MKNAWIKWISAGAALCAIVMVAAVTRGAPGGKKGGGAGPSGKPTDNTSKDDSASADEGANPFPRDWYMGDDKTHKWQIKQIGKPLPTVTADAWFPTETSMLDIHRKIGVVVLWTTYEESCIQALVKLETLKQKFKDKPLGIVAISTLYGNEQAAKVAEKSKITFGVARDDEGKTYHTWHPTSWPTICVTDKEGNIRAMGIKPEYVEAVVVALLKESHDLPADYAFALPATEPSPPAVADASPKKDPEPSEKKEPSDPKSSDALVNGIPRKWLRGTDEERKRFAEFDGKDAPGLHGDNFNTSEVPDLNNSYEKVVVLHFWSATNGASIASLSKLQELSVKYAPKGFVVYGYCNPNGAANMAKILEARGVKYTCGKDTDNTTALRYHLEGSGEHFFLIDRWMKARACDVDKSHLEDAIKILVAEEPDHPKPITASGSH